MADIVPPVFYKVAALDTDQIDALIAIIKRQNPRKVNGRDDPFSLWLRDHDSSYDANYRAYTSKVLPAFAAKFNEKLELLFNQRPLTIRVTNAGQIRADHFVLSVKTNDGWINSKVVLVSPRGPAAPVPTPDYLSTLNAHRNLMHDFIPPRVGRHEFETIRPARRSPEMVASCEDFRSGQHYCFEGVITPSSNPEPLEITVILTAKNLREESTKTFKLEKQVVPMEPCELVDLSTLDLNQEYPTKKEIERLLHAKKYDEIEVDEKDQG